MSRVARALSFPGRGKLSDRYSSPVAGARRRVAVYRFTVGILEMDYAARNTCRGTPARPLFLRRDDAMPARKKKSVPRTRGTRRRPVPPPPLLPSLAGRAYGSLPHI